MVGASPSCELRLRCRHPSVIIGDSTREQSRLKAATHISLILTNRKYLANTSHTITFNRAFYELLSLPAYRGHLRGCGLETLIDQSSPFETLSGFRHLF